MSFIAEAVGGVVDWVTEAGTDLFDWGDWSEDSGYNFDSAYDYLDADDADIGSYLVESGVADEVGNSSWFNQGSWTQGEFDAYWKTFTAENPDLVTSLADETGIPNQMTQGEFDAYWKTFTAENPDLVTSLADETGIPNQMTQGEFDAYWKTFTAENPDLVNSLADETEIPTSTGSGGFNIPGAAKNVATTVAKNAAKTAAASVLGGSGSGSGGSGGSGSSGSGSGGNPLLDAVVLSQLLQKPPSIVQPADNNTAEIVAYNPYDTGLEDNLLPTGEKKDKDKTDEILAALGGIRNT
tara:strand:+ start:468 stop:1355 length:888 start_codon:yes stop_codon:yes gene_type:complete